jgi:hypothetical protein
MSQWMHDERTPSGLGQVLTLTPEVLSRSSRGLLGGGLSESIPVGSIRAVSAVSYQRKGVLGEDRGQGPGQLTIRWADAQGRDKTDTWMVDVDAPTCRALLAALAQLRPDASTAGMSHSAAQVATGGTSLQRVQVITIAVVVLGVVGVGCLLSAVALLWLASVG